MIFLFRVNPVKYSEVFIDIKLNWLFFKLVIDIKLNFIDNFIDIKLNQ